MRITRFFQALVLGATLSTAGLALPAHAAPDSHGAEAGHGDDHGAEAGHGDTHAASAGHGDDGHGADSHGDSHGDGAHGDGHGGGHHGVEPLGDDDGDGTVNWLDSDHEAAAETPFGNVPAAGMWGFHLLNLLILVGVLVWFGRKPIGAFLRDRELGIRKELEDAAGVEAEARSRYQELEQRLAGFEDEVAKMRADAEHMAEVERQEAEKRAQEAAGRIADAAERAIRDETARATRTLRAEAVELAVQLAEDTLRKEVQSNDRERLARAFLDTLQADGGTHG